MKEWICPNCGREVHPGDQICMYCGAQIHNTNVTIEELRKGTQKKMEKPSNRKFLLLVILGVFILVIVVFLLLWFLVLKR